MIKHKNTVMIIIVKYVLKIASLQIRNKNVCEINSALGIFHLMAKLFSDYFPLGCK